MSLPPSNFRHHPQATHRPHQDRHAAEAQAQPEAPHPLHHAAALRPGEEVPGQAVPEHRGAGRVLRLAQAHRDAGQDLVPEPTGQVKAAAGVGAGAAQDRLLAPAGQALRDDPSLASGARPAALPGDAAPAAARPARRPAAPASAGPAPLAPGGLLGVAEHTRAADSEPGGGKSARSQMSAETTNEHTTWLRTVDCVALPQQLFDE